MNCNRMALALYLVGEPHCSVGGLATQARRASIATIVEQGNRTKNTWISADSREPSAILTVLSVVAIDRSK